MKQLTPFLAVFYLLYACNNNPVERDLSNGISTSGIKLTCKDVEVYKGETLSKSSLYTYGSSISIKFSGIMGFKTRKGRLFPGMRIWVINPEGQTVFASRDLYAYKTKGLKESASLNLAADLVLESPVFSGEKYVVKVLIWDKKGRGKFAAEYPIFVEANKHLAVESNSKTLALDEVYLWSESNKQAITGNVLKAGDIVHVIIDGMLENFTKKDETVGIGISLLITGAKGNMLEKNPDFNEFDGTGIRTDDLSEQLRAAFVVPEVSTGPIHVTVEIWDKFVPDESVRINFDAEIE
jgi:hypothetical protein